MRLSCISRSLRIVTKGRKGLGNSNAKGDMLIVNRAKRDLAWTRRVPFATGMNGSLFSSALSVGKREPETGSYNSMYVGMRKIV